MAEIYNVKQYTVVSGTSGNDYITNSVGNVTINGGAGDDIVYHFDGSRISINGGAGSDNIGIVANSSNVASGKNITVTGGTGNDYITSMIDKGVLFEYKSGDGIDFINGFNSNDTLKINAASYSTVANGNDFIVSVGTGYVVLKNSASIPVKIKNSAGQLTTYNTNPSYILFGTDSDDVITNTSKNVSVLGYAGNDTVWNYVDDVIIYGGDGHDDISNHGNNIFISGGNGADSVNSSGNNGIIVGDAGNDTLLVQGALNTLSGGAGNDVLILDAEYSNNAVNYSLGDGYDTVYGFNSRDVLWVYDTFWSTSTVGNDVVLSFQNGSVTLKDTATIHPRLALNLTDKVTDGTILAATEIIDAATRNNAIKITCNELANEIYGGFGNDSLYGGDGNDTIYGNPGNDFLWGQNGNDTIFGGTGNDLIWGGAGNDLFVYTAGNDVIGDYAAGDKISLGTAISSAKLNGSDAVFTTSGGTLTVKNAKGKSLSLITSTGSELSTIISGSNAVQNLTRSNTKPNIRFNGGAGNDTLTNWAGGKGATVNGWSGNDSIKNTAANALINGGLGNDKIINSGANVTIEGGKGNDTLWGGNGADTFIYNSGDGKDVIYNFDNKDMLQITGVWTAAYYKASGRVVFKVDSTYSAIILEKPTAATFNVNGDTYTISGNTLVRK